MLHDVVRTMYNPKFIAELFRSQELYSVKSTRQIFDGLAHSSIMRLNETSMDKVRTPQRGFTTLCSARSRGCAGPAT